MVGRSLELAEAAFGESADLHLTSGVCICERWQVV